MSIKLNICQKVSVFMKCENCNQDFENELEHMEDCPHCGEPLVDENTQDSISRFKWYFVGIVVFCIVMMFYLPR